MPRSRGWRNSVCMVIPADAGIHWCCLSWCCSTARGRVGICPRQGSNFLLLAQEKVTKEKGTPLAGRPRADCSALLGLCGRAELASFAVLTAFKQAARSQFLMRAVARTAKPCAARWLTRAPRAMRSFAAQTSPVYASLRIGKGVTRRTPGSTAARCTALQWIPAFAGMAGGVRRSEARRVVKKSQQVCG